MPIIFVFTFSSLGYFILMTSFTSYLHIALHLPLAFVASALFAYSFVSRASKIVLGPVFDRIRFRVSIPISLGMAALAFLLLWLTQINMTTIPILLCLAGVGISSVALLTQAYISTLSQATPGPRVISFSVIYVLMNIAGLVAPFVAFALLRSAPNLLFAVLAWIYVALVCFSLLFVRDATDRADGDKARFLEGWRDAITSTKYRGLLLSNFVGWFFYSQLFSTLPVYILRQLGPNTRVEIVFTIEFLTVVLLQLLVGRLLQAIGLKCSMPLAFVCYAFAFLGFLLAGSIAAFCTATCVFAIATAVFMPAVDALNSAFATKGNHATYFGILSLTATLGDAMGSFVGLSLFGILKQGANDKVFMLVLALLALTSAFVYQTKQHLLARGRQMKRPE